MAGPGTGTPISLHLHTAIRAPRIHRHPLSGRDSLCRKKPGRNVKGAQPGPLWPEPSELSGRREKPPTLSTRTRKEWNNPLEPNSRREEGVHGPSSGFQAGPCKACPTSASAQVSPALPGVRSWGGLSGCPLLHTLLGPVVRAASVTRELSHPRLLTLISQPCLCPL